jgi:hypothetical protein
MIWLGAHNFEQQPHCVQSVHLRYYQHLHDYVIVFNPLRIDNWSLSCLEDVHQCLWICLHTGLTLPCWNLQAPGIIWVCAHCCRQEGHCIKGAHLRRCHHLQDYVISRSSDLLRIGASSQTWPSNVYLWQCKRCAVTSMVILVNSGYASLYLGGICKLPVCAHCCKQQARCEKGAHVRLCHHLHDYVIVFSALRIGPSSWPWTQDVCCRQYKRCTVAFVVILVTSGEWSILDFNHMNLLSFARELCIGDYKGCAMSFLTILTTSSKERVVASSVYHWCSE